MTLLRRDMQGFAAKQATTTPRLRLEHVMKLADSRSLRAQVQKWLAPDSTAPVHIARYGRLHRARTRYVLVETEAASGPRSMYFFRHADGNWNVFPPG